MGGKKRTRNTEDSAGPSKRQKNINQSYDEETSKVNSTQVSVPGKPYFVQSFVRSGKILRIRLRNFMCHSNLVVDLNQRTNLLVGNNGSGKSAILTALIIGLGSKANVASRSKNIKQLIKRGEQSATIEIHISNDDEFAYEPEKYNDKIIVVRTISQSGATTYKLKNSAEKVISTSKQDLEKMMLFMNIQVENPVCILNQDASRSFLKDSDPLKRYQLFLKATQIESIAEKLNECSIHFDHAKTRLKFQKQLSIALKQSLKEVKDKYDCLQSAQYLKVEASKLKLEQQWMLVIKQEELCQEIQLSITDYEAKLEKIKDSCINKSKLEAEIQAKINGVRDEIEKLQNESNVCTQKCNKIRQQLTEQNEVRQNHLRLMSKNEAKINRLKDDIQQLEKDISERSESYENRVGKMRAENEEKIASLKTQQQDTKAMSDSAKRDIEMLSDTKARTKEEFDNLRSRYSTVNVKSDQIAQQIQKCNTSNKDALLVYGDYMPALVQNIRKLYEKGSFSEMPRGPLGQYVEVTDEKWKGPIESILGALMKAFCVNNARDRNTLNQLITRQYPQARSLPIITSKFCHQVYDVSRHKVQDVQNAYLALNLIKCKDPVVINCLIDQCKVESILLVDNQELAVHLTAEEENVPRNLLKCILTKPFSEYFPAPMYRTYSSDCHVRYLQVNMEQRKAYLTDELMQVKQEKSNLETNLNELKAKLVELDRKINNKREVEDKMENELRFLRTNILELEKIEYPPENEAEILNEELNELREMLTQTDAKMEPDRNKLKEFDKILKEKEAEIRNIKSEGKKFEAEIAEKNREFDHKREQLEASKTNAKYGESKLKSIEENISKLKIELNEANTKNKRLETTAKKHGNRVVSEHTQEEIDAQIRTLDRKMKTVTNIRENIDEIRNLLEAKNQEYTNNQIQTVALEETLTLLYKSRKQRYQWLSQLKHHMCLRIQHTFITIMKLRNYNGEIQMDHEHQKLHLSIVPRDNHIDNAVSNAKCLSGGERSYSTVAFLLSLWSCVNHPFYFLDEYDVYTDQVNRLYMTKLLINEANKKPHRQYTFLTPQDMSEIQASDHLTIHRLADPDRN